MSAAFINALNRIPAPLFGTAGVAAAWGMTKAKALPRYAAWAIPGAVGGMWFVWPAVSDEFKIDIGLMKDPEAEKMAQEAAAEASKPIVLDETAKKAVEVAHKVEVVTLSAEEAKVLAEVKGGEFGTLETDWDSFLEKSIKPGEDDDEDEEEEDEEDDDDDDDDDDDED